MATRRTLGAAGEATKEILRNVINASAVVTPLKDIAEVALRVGQLIERFREDRTEWEEIGDYVQDVAAAVVQSLSQVDTSDEDTKARLETLESKLREVADSVDFELKKKSKNRFGRNEDDLNTIASMKDRIKAAIDTFQIGASTAIMSEARRTRDGVLAISPALAGVAHQASQARANTQRIERNAILDKLQRVQGASWDPMRVCLENTRADLVDEIIAWASTPVTPNTTSAGQGSSNDTAAIKIFLLTGVAGAGKTTIAHTVAQRCAKDRRLASSFFFDREAEGRNSPAALFTTIAADLSGVGHELAECIAAALEDDRSLLSAPIARQFEELVLEPCKLCTFARPMVVIIDALDEASNEDLFEILQDRACHLPNSVRLFLTSRMRPELGSLCQETYVRRVDLDITDAKNLNDISEYAQYRFAKLSRDRQLKKDWPGEDMISEFLVKANGLFLWVATVCDYIRRRSNPTVELRKLLGGDRVCGSSPEARMDQLYATILESFDWEDDSFVADYRRLMGTVIASKSPMTISGMRDLYADGWLAHEFTLQTLSPLLTGMNVMEHSRQPVRVLHQSLREFLVDRSGPTSLYARFHIDEREISADLAVRCMNILNRDLGSYSSLVGYLESDLDEDRGEGVPRLKEGAISEAVWYACQFWPDHVCDSTKAEAVQKPLEQFMTNGLVTWLEITAAYGRCRDVGAAQAWIKANITEDDRQWLKDGEILFATTCARLAERLKYEDRLEEALSVIQGAAEAYRRLAGDQPAAYTPDLAMSLNNLSLRLSDVGRHDEALSAIQEAVELRQRLAGDRPAAYTPDLASSLNNLSLRLSDVGRHDEALSAIQEAVELRQRLAGDRPAAYTPDLASSLNNLSLRLSDVGRHDEALSAIQEAAEAYRRLAGDRPAAYTPDLARSLNNLSLRLSDVGRHDEALSAIQEAVELRQRLAGDRPAAYTPDLAMSLNNLSLRLSDVGRHDEALSAIQEAVELRQRLAGDRPAAYTPDLASSLNNLSGRLSDVGRHDEALSAIQEAAEAYRRLAGDRPAAYTPDLAMSLNNLSGRLSDVGRHDEALSAIQEAAEAYRRLAGDRPAAYTPDLAMSLNNLSGRLSDVGRHDEALSAIQEAAEAYRRLAGDRPAAYTPDLAMSLYNLSIDLKTLSRPHEALHAIQESVRLYQSLMAPRSAVFKAHLRDALRVLSEILGAVNRTEEANAASAEADLLMR